MDVGTEWHSHFFGQFICPANCSESQQNRGTIQIQMGISCDVNKYTLRMHNQESNNVFCAKM